MLGIGEIEKAVDVLAGLANLGGGVLADGKIDLSDMSQLIPRSVPPDAMTFAPSSPGIPGTLDQQD